MPTRPLLLCKKHPLQLLSAPHHCLSLPDPGSISYTISLFLPVSPIVTCIFHFARLELPSTSHPFDITNASLLDISTYHVEPLTFFHFFCNASSLCQNSYSTRSTYHRNLFKEPSQPCVVYTKYLDLQRYFQSPIKITTRNYLLSTSQ